MTIVRINASDAEGPVATHSKIFAFDVVFDTTP